MTKTLPVAGTRRGGAASRRDCGTVRPSRRGPWRAVSLLLVHVAVALHVAHWYTTGRTLTPVEPSEAMQTLGSEALLNAGFIFFILLILGTLVLGRFFCGWACHVVALQDLCTWMLRKLGIRPKPFRSRLLMFVPLLAAFYMFVLPTLVRLYMGITRRPLRAQLMTTDFWDRFPAWPIALLTFVVCGFIIVVLLGNKGFCTYGCPYGGIFAVADKVAPGKIRVTDACEGCAHCTVACTSNVRVHEEVRLYGMVVNPGCMKCMDCINVCPKDALYYGFGAPTLRSGPPRGKTRPRQYDFTWPEEIALAAFFLGSIVILRGLYDSVPFLLALGLSSISAYVLLTALRALTGRSDRVATRPLRQAGRLTRHGVLFLVMVSLWTVFLVHSGLLKHWTHQGFRGLGANRARVAAAEGRLTAETTRGLQHGLEILQRAKRMALVPMARLEAGIADSYFTLGEHELAEAHYRRGVELSSRYAEGHAQLARYLAGREEFEPAVEHMRQALERAPHLPGVHADLADILIRLGKPQEGLPLIRELLADDRGNVELRMSYAALLAHAGDLDGAVTELRQAVKQRPRSSQAHFKLGQILANQGNLEEALTAFQAAVRLQPRFQVARFLAAKAALSLGRPGAARRELEDGIRLEPFHAGMVQAWAEVLQRNGGLDEAIAADEAAREGDGAARFRLFHLYSAAGRSEDARRMEMQLKGGS